MLLNALLRRMNAGTDVTSTRVPSAHRRGSRMIYDSYPVLPQLLVRLLQPDSGRFDSSAAELQRVFAALEILERFGVPERYSGDLLAAMEGFRSCPAWSVREKAAKAMSFCIRPMDIIPEVRTLLVEDWFSLNDLHGRLLLISVIVRRLVQPGTRDSRSQSYP